MNTKLLLWLCGGVLSVATPAFALEPKQCLPAAEMQAALKAEGQVPIITGNRVTTRTDRPANIFTANTNGIGYNLEGDAPRGTPSSVVCVVARYHDLKLNDITSSVVPAWALVGNTQSAAKADCAARKAGVCDSHDDYIRRATANRMRVMLLARTDSTAPDGSRHDGRLITVLTLVDKQLAEVTGTNAAGANESMGGLEAVNYTQFAGNFLTRN